MRTLLKHAKKYGNMQNMWQLHIPVKMTCLTVLVARGRITAEYGWEYPPHTGYSSSAILAQLTVVYNRQTDRQTNDRQTREHQYQQTTAYAKKTKGSPYSITERRVPQLIPVLGSQPAGDVSHKPSRRLPLLSARPAVTPATLKRTATNFAAWWTEAWWVWTVSLRLLPDSIAAAIWTQALLRLSPVC